MVQIALIHQRPSDVEGISAGPLAEILNYTTGISFEGFSVSESEVLLAKYMYTYVCGRDRK